MAGVWLSFRTNLVLQNQCILSSVIIPLLASQKECLITYERWLVVCFLDITHQVILLPRWRNLLIYCIRFLCRPFFSTTTNKNKKVVWPSWTYPTMHYVMHIFGDVIICNNSTINVCSVTVYGVRWKHSPQSVSLCVTIYCVRTNIGVCGSNIWRFIENMRF